MPLPTVVQVRERLVPARPEKRVAEPEAQKLRRALATAAMEISAVLGSVTMSLGEIRSLAPGSVVLLQKLGNEVPRVALQCGRRTLFSGTVVEDKGWYRFVVQPILSGGKQDGDRRSA
jgi:flagellar motor switch protein FliM